MGANALAYWAYLCWCVVNAWKRELYDHNNSDAGTGHDDVPLAYDDLGDVHHSRPAGLRTPCAYCGWIHAIS